MVEIMNENDYKVGSKFNTGIHQYQVVSVSVVNGEKKLPQEHPNGFMEINTRNVLNLK